MESSTLHAASALKVSGGPIRSVTVTVDPSLTGRIAFDMRADDEKEMADVSVSTKGRSLVIDVPLRDTGGQSRRSLLDRILGRRRVVHGDLVGGRSGDGKDQRPTLDLTLRVPLGCATKLNLSGLTRATVGDLMGNLRMDLSGSVQATVGSVLAARVDARGSAWAAIAATHGELEVGLTGSARIKVALARAGNLSLRSTGACVLEVDGGELGEATAVLSGASVARIDALIAGDLTFDGSGSFEADFVQVLGQTESSHTGSGTIRVGGRRQPSA